MIEIAVVGGRGTPLIRQLSFFFFFSLLMVIDAVVGWQEAGREGVQPERQEVQGEV